MFTILFWNFSLLYTSGIAVRSTKALTIPNYVLKIDRVFGTEREEEKKKGLG